MATGRYCKLIMITTENNNKFYEMTEANGEIQVKYGRVDSSSVSVTYPLYKWDSLKASKEKKGYKDVTDLVSVVVTDNKSDVVTYTQIKDSQVNKFITLMKKYTDGLVKKVYSVKSTSVTAKQVEAAQTLLDELTKLDPKKDDHTKINNLLISLYTSIPRYMGNTREHLLPAIEKTFAKVIAQEQDNLDAMAGQVQLNTKDKPTKKDVKKVKTILDDLGITMEETKPTQDIQYLLDQIKSSGRKVAGLFACNKPSEDKNFEQWIKDKKKKDTKHLIHGTRCTSVIPILQTSLQIRPAGNFSFSGKAYGDGNYFSEVVQKSLGYTGHDNDKVLLVYEVHIGNPFVYEGWYKGNSFTLNLTELQKRGYDCTYVKAGNGLLNSEIIAYSEKQNRLKYIIWLQ